MKYEPLLDTAKIIKRLEQEGLGKVKEWFADGCFYVPTITIGGKKPNGEGQWGSDIGLLYRYGGEAWEHYKDEHYDTERIQGCYCPDCGAEAFKTDQVGVASCGSYPGWYFYYNAEQENQGNDQSFKYELNSSGELVKVASVDNNSSEKEETTA